jgi:CRISPR-associated protein Cas2
VSERVMLMVYCYDIRRDRTRARVAAVLEDQAARVQDSVFEVRLSQSAADRLYQRILPLLEDGDMVRMYAIGAAGLPRCRSHGGAPIMDDADYWIV